MYILLLHCFRTLFNLISIPLVVSLYEIVLKEVGVVISTCDARKLSYYMQHTLKVSRDFASNLGLIFRFSNRGLPRELSLDPNTNPNCSSWQFESKSALAFSNMLQMWLGDIIKWRGSPQFRCFIQTSLCVCNMSAMAGQNLMKIPHRRVKTVKTLNILNICLRPPTKTQAIYKDLLRSIKAIYQQNLTYCKQRKCWPIQWIDVLSACVMNVCSQV